MDPRSLACLTQASMGEKHRDWEAVCFRLARGSDLGSRLARIAWADQRNLRESVALEILDRFGGDGIRDRIVAMALCEYFWPRVCPSCRGHVVPDEARLPKGYEVCRVCHGSGRVKHTWLDRGRALGVSIGVYRYRYHRLYQTVLEKLRNHECELFNL